MAGQKLSNSQLTNNILAVMTMELYYYNVLEQKIIHKSNFSFYFLLSF